jgi:uncharacterized protein (TIGR02147 family)
MNLPAIFDYFDYVKYLRDYYEARHSADRWFSYRYIQTRTGIDPGYLYKIFQGKKPLAQKMVEPLAGTLKLSKRESAYFALLVRYGNAKSNEEIRLCFEQLVSYSEVIARKVDAGQYEYYTRWYHAALRQILTYYPFKDDYEFLAKMTVPAISAREAKKAVALLHKLGFIKETSDGHWRVIDRFLSTGEDWHSIGIRAFQRDTIMLASQALDTVPKTRRDISTVSVTLSEEGFKEAGELIKQFRRDMLELANRQEPPMGAYHMNIQLIPIGRVWQGEGQ